METKILFVEDEDRGVKPYFTQLEKHGFKCVLAQNGKDALAKLAKQRFDMISLDIMFLPDEKFGSDATAVTAGVRLLEMIRGGELKNCDSNIKVVILTAGIDPIVEKKIRKLGISTYLKKPINYNRVVEAFCRLRNRT